MNGHLAGGKECQNYSTKNIWKVKAYIAIGQFWLIFEEVSSKVGTSTYMY